MTATPTLARPATTSRGAQPRPAGAPSRSPDPGGAPAWDRVRFSGAAGLSEPRQAGPAELAQLPPAAPWAATLARAAVEVLTGSRPTAQLARWLTADIYESLARRAGLAVRIMGRPDPALCARVRRVLCSEVRPGVHEVTVVVDDGVRVRGAAVRVECHRGRWRATALEIG